MRVKLAAFVISAFITGLIGGLWFYFITQVLPPSGFDPAFNATIALMAFFGGLGTVAGPVLGALIIEPAQQYLTQQFTNDFLSQIVLGGVFLAVILLVPRGVIPTVGEKMTSWRAKLSGHLPDRIAVAAGRPAREPGAAAGAPGKESAR
jgi:branched-chain amino acid transport system permease protein